MDNRWQLSKCGSTWQSSAEPPTVVAPAPASQVKPHDSSGNSRINPSHYSYPHIVQEPCSSTHKMMADPLLQTTNFNLYNSGRSVLGSSFFTLLSGPPSFSQYDSQRVLSSKPSNPSNPSSKVPVYGSSSIISPTEREVSFRSAEPSSQNIDNRYLKSRTETTPVPIRTLASDGGNTASCLHDIVQARKVNDQSLELPKAANYHTSHGFSSLKAAPVSGPIPAQSGKLHSSSTPSTSGFPRVFCLYASGDLFLSNSGLFGVTCSCHGLRLSISKFSEHSGLRDVNPGDAVHTDSGETIAQWRKVYFCKFGIRIPEDQCGWHWPEGFSEAADFVKRVPNVLRSSDLSNSVGPPRAPVASKQTVFPDNHHSSQKLVNEILCHETKRNAHNSPTLPNGNVHSGAANKITEQHVYGCLLTSKFAGGTNNDLQSNQTYIDPNSKAKNAFSSQKNLQNLRSLCKDSDIFKFNNSRDGDILEKATVSSNIELRLGQPSQHSQALGNSNVPGFNALRVSRVDHPAGFISSEPLIHNGNNRITEESRQFVNCAAQAAKSSSIGGQNWSKFSNLGFGAYSTRNPPQTEQLKSDMVAGSVSSVLFSHSGNPRPPLISGTPSIVFSSMGMNSSPNMTMSKEEATRVMNSHTPSFRQAVKYSNRDHVSSSCGFNKDQSVPGNSSNENFKSLITLPSKITKRRDGHDSSVIAVSREASFQIRDIGVQSNLLCDPHQTGPPLPRVAISENIRSSSGHGKCCHGTSCVYIPDKHSCCVQKSNIIENFNLETKNSLGTFGEPLQIRDSILSASNLDKGCTLLGSKSISSGKIGEPMKPNLKKVEFNAFQWKDVPSKTSGRCHVPSKDQTAIDDRTDVEDQTSDLARKCFDQSVQKADFMKEQVMSNISSKCSAPAITQVSIKISNGDSCTDDAQNTGYAKNFAVDEGSGIQKSWSSDDAFDCGSNTRFDGFASKNDLKNEALSKGNLDRSTHSLIDELRVIDSLRTKKVQNQVHTGLPVHENTSSMRTFEKEFQAGKRKRETKFKILGAPFPASPVSSVSTGSSGQSSQSLEDLPMVVQPSQERSKNCTCSIGHSFKRRRSTLPASSTVCCKEHVHKLDKSTKEHLSKTPRRVYDDCFEIPEPSHGKKLMLDSDFSETKQVWKQELPCKRFTKPVVCGKYGLISNGDTSKPAKIFSLAKILKIAKRCDPAGNKVLKKSPAKTSNKAIIKEGNRRSARISNFSEDKCHVGQRTSVFSDVDPIDSDSYILEKGKEHIDERSHGIPDSDLPSKTRRKNKEVRKRSLYELITKGKDSDFATISKNMASVPQDTLKNVGDSNNLLGEDNTYRSPEELKCRSSSDVDRFCHVCGGLNNDEMNCLLECNRCLIKVHQACYGISKVPKSHWYCRPCRENATNIVCVLCGYEGGVMTRAVQSSNIVRSLLITWNVVLESTQVLEDQLNTYDPSGNQVQVDNNGPPNTINERIKASSIAGINSVTAGILDPTVKQWVHMVCGLWTPGTRCPNVDTMSTFDVSGASHPTENVVCSMCKRAGGCCIRCRVIDCAIHFHPWCAHRKGLLQSEVEGADNEKVGFYGRCELHATEDHKTNSHSIQVMTTHEKETCARTEGYKGRKREGFRHDNRQLSGGTRGCLVRQEQVDAWNHINRQLSFKRRLQKPPVQPVQDIEHDFRKEYARYKQSKGWKHLVVYKSGIHALGLYTSLFISQGAMVVEYVGEIVGLRVADRRESEYQSGKQLQYKSACYFFRIDKEHIIDATRKGGIARFVNHSCQPNCVAKVITVRGEKKVVFFAERDIYPGEEITYDYHFNNEDEGKKILCSCNSNNCRRYLN